MTIHSSFLPFLAGGGAMGARIRAYPWEHTPLGAPSTWPEALRCALSICLNSSFPTAIYWGPDLRVLYNDAWAPIPAEKHPWALGRPAREVWADIWDVIQPQMQQVMSEVRGFSTFDQMLPMQRGGRTRETYWNYSLTPILAEDGSVAGLFNQGHETTAQVVAQREHEAQNERLRKMFEQAPGAIALVTGPRHIFNVTNAAYRRLINRQNVVGMPVADALPEVIDQGFVELLDRVYTLGERYVGNKVLVKLHQADGSGIEEHYLDFIYEPIRNPSGEVDGIFIQATDVTERTRAEAALQALNATLEQRVTDEVARRAQAEQTLRQMQKIEALGQLTGGIAHDFNNMLAVVMSGLTLLRRRMERGETNLEPFINGAIESTQRAAALTQRLLTFARQQPLNPEPVDVNRLISDMRQLLTRTLGESIQVSAVPASDPAAVSVDRNQLESALLNLAVNARDAMTAGGELIIKAAHASIGEEHPDRHSARAGGYVSISLSDNGCGMTPDTKARAFEPFFTTKPVGSGTGLGLSQVLGFVTQSGGLVKIDSEPGRGTTVSLYLPRIEGAAAMTSNRASSSSQREGEKDELILVVEDEPRVLAFTVAALKDLGYSVLSAADASSALQILDQGHPVTLIFTDIMMPGMTGRQLAAQVANRSRPPKVIYTTGYAPDLTPSENILLKPFSIEELAIKIRTALDADGTDDASLGRRQ